jgi:hypothetical protein
MAIWQWALIDLGILAVGMVWLGMIVGSLAKSAKRLANDNGELHAAIEKLSASTEAEGDYHRPETNLEDSAFERTAILLKRMRTQDQKREAKKRRLIARFSTRK